MSDDESECEQRKTARPLQHQELPTSSRQMPPPCDAQSTSVQNQRDSKRKREVQSTQDAKRSNYVAEYQRNYRSQKRDTSQPEVRAEFLKKEAQRVREYRASKKSTASQEIETVGESTYRQRAASQPEFLNKEAQRLREYRARRKSTASQEIETEAAYKRKSRSQQRATAQPEVRATFLNKEAQRLREYRACKKAKLTADARPAIETGNKAIVATVETVGPAAIQTISQELDANIETFDFTDDEAHDPHFDMLWHQQDVVVDQQQTSSDEQREIERQQQQVNIARDRQHPIEVDGNQPNIGNSMFCDNSNLTYTNYQQHQKAHDEFNKLFKCNPFGYACTVCDRLWFKNDLKVASASYEDILKDIIENFGDINSVMVCSTCKSALEKKKIPIFSVHNGFKYPAMPTDLPSLDLVTERLISPRIPFMQIRRLRHVHGQYGIYGQVINVPVSVNTMVNRLPRDIDDDHCVYVHIKRKKIHKSSFVQGLVNKGTVKAWLQYLINKPLYVLYEITVDDSFFNSDFIDMNIPFDELSEDVPIEESLTAAQHTLMWNDEKYLRIAPGENNAPMSLLFDEHAEELAFPSIYLGQFRTFKDGLNITPFQMATSELRRSDRRGVTSHHLLYMGMKIMRIRVRDSLSIAFKHVGTSTNITREQVQSEEYINGCIDTNLAFLKSIPNSAYYWSQRKKDLFAVMRQKGKPTSFTTFSANEIGWSNLLKLLYKLKNNGQEISNDDLELLNYMEKSILVNEDAVTCAIYFNKLVNVLLTILQSKRFSPFGRYRVVDYFKRIEFQHRGSPHAHILLWLQNAPVDILGAGKNAAIEMIDYLISVSAGEASGNIKLQIHKHTFTCLKKIAAQANQKCRFEAPFMPSRNTVILEPMDKSDPDFKNYASRYKTIRINLENNDYDDIDTFYRENNISDDEDYYKILCAGINRCRPFCKRTPLEKWHNMFNPFLLKLLCSNMDFQIILEEYSCAAYVVEYINKTNRGLSNLSRRITEIVDEHPEFDIVEITRKLGVDIINNVELSSQEAAWYLLRESMSKSSIAVTYIPTVWPIERQRIRKTLQELENLDAESTDIWKENWFDKYEKRPQSLSNVTLAQFVSKYYKNNKGEYQERQVPRVIRYRHYDMASEINDYKREMVTLYILFTNENEEILAEMKFIKMYDDNEALILERRKEFDAYLDIDKTIEICRKMCREAEEDEEEVRDLANRIPDENPYEELFRNPNSDVNADLRLATLNKLGAIAKKKQNLMENTQFWSLMRSANVEQKGLLFHVISHLLSDNASPLQVFFTGPAGCGKTFVIKLLMEIYNRFSDTDGYCNAYITCASTGKAAVAIEGTTVHTALKITLSHLLPRSFEVAQQYRALFKFVKVLIIDEVSMIGAELLAQIDSRLKQITGNFNDNFGGIDIILIGDLRQLPPVRATPIFKQPKQTHIGPILWRNLKFYQLTQVMRQCNVMFSSLLTKIGNGSILNDDELALLESRFFTKEDAARLCPHGTRLFFTNDAVTKYNNSILQAAENKVTSIATDVICGTSSAEQLTFVTQKLHKMTVIDTGGLPYEITLVLNKFYLITTNIDVSDGLANGAIGRLVHIEYNGDKIKRVWLDFPDAPKTGEAIRRKSAAYAQQHDISRLAVPILPRTSSISLNNNKTIVAKRQHFPLISACAMTIHKSQGGTFPEIVYEYDKKHSQQLLYVALSRVTSIEGLYLVSNKNDFKFYHGRRYDQSMAVLATEFHRLSLNSLPTIDCMLRDFILTRKGLSIFTINCQGLRSHAVDIIDNVSSICNFLLISETNLSEEQSVDIPHFNCVVKFKRSNTRTGGVAIYHNENDSTNVVTPRMDLIMQNVMTATAAVSDVSDICATRCITNTGCNIILITVYISPNQTVENIRKFLHFHLLPYSEAVSLILNEKYHELPMILTGDFNVNFADQQKSQPLLQFLKDTFNLTINNDPLKSTTRYGTTLDAVFSRFLDTLESETFISYYSYHKPIVSSVLVEDRENIIIEPVDDNDVNVEPAQNIQSVTDEPRESS